MKITAETKYGAEYLPLIEKVYNAAARHFCLPEKTEIIISFLTEEEIREVNLSSRQKDSVTDVLSFPYLSGIKGKKLKVSDFKTDINPYSGCLMLGEVNICPQRAAQQAEDYGHSIERETAYLALHGLLHILGYDHQDGCEEAEMHSKEEEILTFLGITRN